MIEHQAWWDRLLPLLISGEVLAQMDERRIKAQQFKGFYKDQKAMWEQLATDLHIPNALRGDQGYVRSSVQTLIKLSKTYEARTKLAQRLKIEQLEIGTEVIYKEHAAKIYEFAENGEIRIRFDVPLRKYRTAKVNPALCNN